MKRHRFERPGYVTFLCVFLLAGAVAELALYFFLLHRPKDDAWNLFFTDSIPGAFVLSLTGGDFVLHSPDWLSCAQLAIAVLCGVFMLGGANWARILFCMGCPALCLWSCGCWIMVYSADMCYIGFRMAVLVAVCVALTMERANRFFTGRDVFFKRFRGRGKYQFQSSRYDY